MRMRPIVEKADPGSSDSSAKVRGRGLTQETFYLRATRLARLSRGGDRHLTLVLEWEEGGHPFTIRDNFNQSLRASQRLLLEAGDRAHLLSASGRVLSQPATPEARFVSAFAEGPVKAALADLPPLRALLTVTSGAARCGRLALVDGGGKTRVSANLRELCPIDGDSIVLVTVRELRGYGGALRDLLSRLHACDALPLAAGNLYRVMHPASMSYTARPSVEVRREDTAFDAANALIGAHLPIVRANEPGIVADIDTEFLHDYRIALRKIRSVLSLFKGIYAPEQTVALKARFAALMAPTGPLRDDDVYLLERRSFYAMVPDTMHGGLDRMFERVGQRRLAAWAGLADRLRGKGYIREIEALMDLFSRRKTLLPGPNADRMSQDLASELIRKRYRRIRRIAAGLTAGMPDDEVHALRVECKKLRYLIEFFGPMFQQDGLHDILKSLKKLQDSLGSFNDCVVQQAGLLAFLDNLGDEPRRLEIAQSIGALVTVLHQRQIVEHEKIVQAFAHFSGDGMRQAFRRLFHDGKDI